MAKSSISFESLLAGFNYVGCALTTFMMLLIVADIAGRNAFNSPMAGVPEFAALSVVTISFLQMPYALRRGRFLQSTMIIDRLSPRGKAIQGVMNSVLGLVLFTIAVVAATDSMLQSWAISEYAGGGSVAVPVYPTKTVIVIGCVVILIQLVLNLGHSLRLLGGQRSSGEPASESS